jgi:hypothetical protein
MGSRDLEADHTAAWINFDYDEELASDHTSRYGHYLRDRQHRWGEDHVAPSPQARQARSIARCWQIATEPIMSPALVALHPRIRFVIADMEDHLDNHLDVRLVLATELVANLPPGTHRALGTHWHSWQHSTHPSHGPAWTEPDGRHGAVVRTALPVLALRWPVPARTLPSLSAVGVPAASDAIAAVRAIVGVLNGELRPVLAHLATAD